MSGEGHRLQRGWSDNCIFLFLDAKKYCRLSSLNIVAIFRYHSKAAIRFNFNPIELPGDDGEVPKDWTQLYPNSINESIKVETPVSVGSKVRT